MRGGWGWCGYCLEAAGLAVALWVGGACVEGGRQSRQDFLSAALAPGLITNQAVSVYPFIVEENYLHNTTPRNLYLALFPWRNTGRSGGAQKCTFSPNVWEVNSSSWVCCSLPAQGTGCKLNKYSTGVTIYHVIFGTSISSKPCFLQALAGALCWYLNVVYQLPKQHSLGLSCAC